MYFSLFFFCSSLVQGLYVLIGLQLHNISAPLKPFHHCLHTVWNINYVYVRVCAPACLQMIAAPCPVTWTTVFSSTVSKTSTHSPPTQSPSVQYTATPRDQKSPYLSSQVQNRSEVSQFTLIYRDSSLDLNSSPQLCTHCNWMGRDSEALHPMQRHPCGVFVWLTSRVFWSSHFNHSSCRCHL